MSNIIKTNNTLVFTSGYYLQKYLDNQHIDQNRFAKTLGLSNKALTEILNGDSPLTEDLINKIATTLGTSKALWQNLDRKFQKAKQQQS